MTHELDEGAAIHLSVATLRAVLRWTPAAEHGMTDIDLSALLLDAGGRVRSQGDFVFYNQRRHPTGLVQRLPRRRDAQGLRAVVVAELARLDPGVTRVVLAASADGGFHADTSRPRLQLHDGAGPAPLAVFPLTPSAGHTAVVCGELRRTPEGWDFRAARRSFTGGLVALAATYGITPAGTTPPPTPPRLTSAPGSPAYGYPQPDPAFTLPPQGPQFLPEEGPTA